MKPGRYDRKILILIQGAELEELQRHTWLMAESFGLDGRIDRYQGKRPIGLYRWDLEYLLEVLEMVLADPKAYPSHDSAVYLTASTLYYRLRHEYDAAYGEEFGYWSSPDAAPHRTEDR
ncbi:MAG: hypothetical protein HY331_16845 [Chloroflexi bacterium]|nr:hypothetical protein [Chloroflexota bacterium]